MNEGNARNELVRGNESCKEMSVTGMWEVDPNGSSFARSFGSLAGFGGFWGLGFWLGWSGKHVVLRGGSR